MISYTSGSLGNLSRHLKRKHPTISTATLERQTLVAENFTNYIHPNTKPVHEQQVISMGSSSSVGVESSSSVRVERKTLVQPRVDGVT